MFIVKFLLISYSLYNNHDYFIAKYTSETMIFFYTFIVYLFILFMFVLSMFLHTSITAPLHPP